MLIKCFFLMTFFFAFSHSNNESDTESEDLRKHYGLNFNKCHDFQKSFKCMSACKSMGYKVFRLDNHCNCTCREMKTTTELPFFKWRTNGTTTKVPKTFSIQLYHIVGTLSPATEESSEEKETTIATTAGCNCDQKCSNNSSTSEKSPTNSETSHTGAPNTAVESVNTGNSVAATTALKEDTTAHNPQGEHVPTTLSAG